MPFHPCVSGCGRYLATGDGHDRCLTCLGVKHAEVAFVDESCSHCGKMTVSELRARLRYLQGGGVPLPLLRSGTRSGGRQTSTTSGSSTGGLRVTVVANPAGNQPSGDHRSSCTSDPVEQPTERAGPSTRSVPAVSSGPPPDQMLISALEGELSDEDSAALPPSGTVAKPESDPEMAAMLSRAAERVGWKI